jgi:hypothetical protein
MHRDTGLRRRTGVGRFVAAFGTGMTERGYQAGKNVQYEVRYVEGENIIIERRFWNNDSKQLAKFAAELIALDVAISVDPPVGP